MYHSRLAMKQTVILRVKFYRRVDEDPKNELGQSKVQSFIPDHLLTGSCAD